MMILGVDPGLNATGYGVIDASSNRLRLVAAGAIKPSQRRWMAPRLLELYEGLARVMEAHRPRVVVLESLFTHHHYLTTAALMAHARAIPCLLSAQHNLTLIEYLPTRVKKALTGYGTASKDQVSRAVGTWLHVDSSSWASDVSDALALAIAHAHIANSPAGRLMSQRPGRRAALPALANGATLK